MNKTIKTPLLYALLLCTAIVTGGCTRNNGDIGAWFGRWQLTEIRVDGTVDSGYGQNIFWSFQNSVFGMWKIYPGDPGVPYDSRFGTWEASDDTLTINMTHSDEANESGTGQYAPYPETHLPANAVTTLHINQKPGNKMELTYTSDGGTVYTYFLTKR